MSDHVDENGITHAPKCHHPGITVKPSTLAGWNLARCGGCKGQRLTRRTTTTTGTAR